MAFEAASKGDLELIELLNTCEMDFNQSNYDKRTIGHISACENHHNILNFLSIHTHFDFQASDRNGKSTLDEI